MADRYTDKAAQLRAFKRLATGLFLLMLAIYALSTWWAKAYPAAWIGYLRAFAEAGMVGALADWFAVTALFHHPLGLPLFCSSSHAFSGAKYSTIASPDISRLPVNASSASGHGLDCPMVSIALSFAPTSLLP